MISTLTLALSVLHQNDIRASVNKSNSKMYQLFYRYAGKNRVMLVPKDTDNPQQLQREVEILLKRNAEEQHRLGAMDA